MFERGGKFSSGYQCAGLYQGAGVGDSLKCAQLLRSHFFDHTIHGDAVNLITLVGGEEVEGAGNAAQGAGAGDLMALDPITLLQLSGGNAMDPMAWGELKLGPI